MTNTKHPQVKGPHTKPSRAAKAHLPGAAARARAGFLASMAVTAVLGVGGPRAETNIWVR